MSLLLIALLISLGIQMILFLVAYFLKTDKLTDFSYALTFIVLAVYAFILTGASGIAFILFTLIVLWALRLGIYLVIRINKEGKDARFDSMRESFVRFFAFWLFQGVTVWVILLPLFFYVASDLKLFSFVSLVGVLLWIKGFVIETLADAQKFRFKNNPKNKNTFIQSGLWKYSRHPNYYGEFLMWLGIYLFTLPTIIANWYWGLFSPLYILFILLFISGIPKLEKSYQKRFKKKWEAYKKKTSVFILWPPRQ